MPTYKKNKTLRMQKIKSQEQKIKSQDAKKKNLRMQKIKSHNAKKYQDAINLISGCKK